MYKKKIIAVFKIYEEVGLNRGLALEEIQNMYGNILSLFNFKLTQEDSGNSSCLCELKELVDRVEQAWYKFFRYFNYVQFPNKEDLSRTGAERVISILSALATGECDDVPSDKPREADRESLVGFKEKHPLTSSSFFVYANLIRIKSFAKKWESNMNKYLDVDSFDYLKALVAEKFLALFECFAVSFVVDKEAGLRLKMEELARLVSEDTRSSGVVSDAVAVRYTERALYLLTK
jgi:hypothetical protein